MKILTNKKHKDILLKVLKLAKEGKYPLDKVNTAISALDYEVYPLTMFLEKDFWMSISITCNWKESIYCGSCGNEAIDIGWRHNAEKFYLINITEDFEKAIEYLDIICVK